MKNSLTLETSQENDANAQLENFIAKQSLPIPRDLNLDGKIHRFGEGQKGREPHWYIGTRDNGKISLTIGSHKNEESKISFHSKGSFATKSFWKKGASLLERWESCENKESFPYLKKKGISGLFGARVNYFGDLVVPMYSSLDGALTGLQTITENGKKLFVPGSRKKNAYFEIPGTKQNDQFLFVAEGFATAITVHMATGSRVICAFDCGNLPLIVENFAEKYPNLQIVVAGDDDRFGGVNSGRLAAKSVAKISSAIFPVFSSDEGNPTDWNDLHVRESLDEVKKQIEATLDKAENGTLNELKSKEASPEDDTLEMLSGKEHEGLVKKAPCKNLRKRGLNTDTGTDIEKRTPPRKDLFVLPGLPIGHVGLLCSPGGAGKSGLSLLLANQIACGGKKDFIGLGEQIPGSVVLLSLEDPLYIYNSRQLEIRKDLSADEYLAFDKNLHFMDATDMQNQMSADFVIESIKELFEKKPESAPLRLVIIDHLSYWSNQDLNDGGQCTNIVKDLYDIADSLNCAVLVLHHTNRNALIKGKDRQTGSVNIGGSYKLHSLTRWVAVLEHVEKSELKKVHKIEGNEEDFKLLLLDKVNHGEKLKILLKKRPDRLGLLYGVGFGEKKPETKKESVQEEIVSKEEVENFNMGEASPKLMTVDENTHHIMNWLTRNPAFETVSPGRRKELTAIVDGKEHDKDRSSASIYKDVWVDGDTLIVDGPVCDQEDMKLFALLVNELTRLHNFGARGLILEISLSKILALTGLNISGLNFHKVHRQLNRLRRMALDFKNSRGHRWRGPLINDVFTIGEGRNCKVRIGFNHFMVTFYKIQEYTMFQKSIAQSLKGDSLSFYIFYASQNWETMKISVEKCKKLLGIPSTFDKKEALKKIKKSIADLVAAGVMDPKNTGIKDGNVYTTRSPLIQ